ncbi:MAG: hypothetical protein L6V86_01375 [Treponema sp.]|nr:MAG: hypothetical protein L6V86_01375 [Treponema sp.]
MESRKSKEEYENKILSIFTDISNFQDKNFIEFQKLIQKIYTPIWKWTLLCFDEYDVRNAGIEIFRCVKRCILNYKEVENHSFIGFLYTYLETEIKHKKQRGEFSKLRMCSRDDYNKALKLIKTAEQMGKNPNNQNVQEWLAKQSDITVEQIKDLVLKYYQSQIVEETSASCSSDNESPVSIFDTDSVRNNHPSPESVLIAFEDVTNTLDKIENEFNLCQTRQKVYLASFITLRTITALETKYEVEQIYEMLKVRSFAEPTLLEYLFTKKELPSQKELCENFNKDEGYISNRIKEFFEKVQNKISSS